MIEVYTSEIRNAAKTIKAGDEVLLYGDVIVARDAVHKRLFPLLGTDKMPIDIKDKIIYYGGPTPKKGDMPAGAFGPTTSSRMDAYAPAFLQNGLCGMIGKGNRAKAVYDAIKKYGGIYFCAVGGAGALYAASTGSLTEVAYTSLGCESLKIARLNGFYVFCGIDASGRGVFEQPL